MSRANVEQAVNDLKNVVLADDELRAIAKQANSIEDLQKLWQSERFRAAHDRAVAGVSEQDVRSYVEELSDEQLDHVAGGVLIGSQPTTTLSPQQVYVAALGSALSSAFQKV